jgi:hypothetical protein
MHANRETECERRWRTPDDPCARHRIRQARGRADDRALPRQRQFAPQDQGQSSPTPTGAATRRCWRARIFRPAPTSWSSSPAIICARPASPARSAVPRPDTDPLRHGRARALSRAAADLALRLLDLSGQLMAGQGPLRIRFILNGEDVALADVAPDATLLDYLRLAGRCAAPRKAARRRLRRLHRAGRPALRRRARLRIGQRLHPLPRLARRHACRHRRASLRPRRPPASGAAGDGRFPRLAMRLLHAGLRHVALCAVDARSPPSDEAIEKALQGNLCRCTGYEAIVKARARSPVLRQGGEGPAGGRAEASVAARLPRCATAAASRSATGKDRGWCCRPMSTIFAAHARDEPNRRPSSPAPPMSACGSRNSCATSRPVVFIGHLDEAEVDPEADGVLTIGAGVTYTSAQDGARASASRPSAP